MAKSAEELRAYYARKQAEYRARNPERAKEFKARSYAKCRAYMVEAKNRPCADCGVSYPPVVMDFDHVDGSKVMAVSRIRTGMKALVAEIAKCEVVCANCHRLRTEARRQEKKRAAAAARDVRPDVVVSAH